MKSKLGIGLELKIPGLLGCSGVRKAGIEALSGGHDDGEERITTLCLIA